MYIIMVTMTLENMLYKVTGGNTSFDPFACYT